MVIQMSTSIANEPISPLLKESEVAQILNLEVATLRRWRWSGHGPRFVKLGGAVRYRATVIETFISESERASTTELERQATERSNEARSVRDQLAT